MFVSPHIGRSLLSDVTAAIYLLGAIFVKVPGGRRPVVRAGAGGLVILGEGESREGDWVMNWC